MNKQNTAGTDMKDLHVGSTKPSLHSKMYRKLVSVIMNKQILRVLIWKTCMWLHKVKYTRQTYNCHYEYEQAKYYGDR